MITKTTGILLIAGIVIGIIASIGAVMLTQTGSPGDCTAVLPQVLGSPDPRAGMGDIPVFSSEEQAQKFLISHTDTGGSSPGSGTVTTPPRTTAASTAPGGERTWSFDVDTSTFKPDEYLVTASAVLQTAQASALFNVLEPSAGPLARQAGAGSSTGSGTEYYITIDPIGDHYIGDRFTITGTTNIPADGDMLVQVVSSSFKPTQKSQSGEFSGVGRTVKASDAPRAAVPVPTAVPSSVPTSVEERKHSTTNVQVREVDEADIVKTNGTFIYTVTGNTLRIINAYPAEHAKIVATLKFSGSPVALYLNGDRLIVVSEESATREYWQCAKIGCTDATWSRPVTQIFTYAVSDPAHPELVRQVTIDGSYSDSRMIGTYLYFVTANPAGTDSGGKDFPQVLDYAKGTITPNVYYFDRTDKAFTYTTVGAFNTATNAPVKAKSFLIGSAGTVYVSPTHLYIAIAAPVDDNGAVQTDIYSFAIDDAKIAYTAQGTVNGALLNQYSLDESGGNLRLATTGIEGAGKYRDYFNTVYVLDSSMKAIGGLKKIAPGEKISYARFVGSRLYLALQRESDQFLVIDLSDPAKMQVLGQLQLPGYAGYLHPYDESYMISIGKEVNNGGVRIALFNVTNVSAPTITDTIELGSRGSDSEVLRDPKAFLFDKEMNLLVLPVHLVGQSGTVAYKKYQMPEKTNVWGGVYVFSVGPSQGFHLKGTVEHYDSSTGSWSPVKRSLYIEDTLYTLSSDMIVMSDLKNGLGLVNSLGL
nr:beta-propeller domain-containing protein [uncultured Methanoregula sp.]